MGRTFSNTAIHSSCLETSQTSGPFFIDPPAPGFTFARRMSAGEKHQQISLIVMLLAGIIFGSACRRKESGDSGSREQTPASNSGVVLFEEISKKAGLEFIH